MREYRGLPFDENGAFGRGGQIRPELLRRLFNEAALSAGGENFYLRRPPKSSDPRWYRKIYDENLSFADNLRTAEYLSAYGFVYNLRYVPPGNVAAIALSFVRRRLEKSAGARGF